MKENIMKNARRTKIVCTLGPAVADEEKLIKLIESGCDVARFNFSHGDQQSHGKMYNMFDRARKAVNRPIAAMLDTRGPEVRTGLMEKDGVFLKAGSLLMLTPEEVLGTDRCIGINYKDLARDVAVGQTILIDDGLVAMTVEEISKDDLVCRVQNDGLIKDRKSVNIPGVILSIPYLGERDKKDLLLGIEMGFDFIAASFASEAQNVLDVRNFLNENGGSHVGIIAKIESARGVEKVDEILQIAEGLMIARGDLGVEIPYQDVPIVQKALIKKALAAGKISITATQMLESMVKKPRPTRAEAADVANAIYDGTGAVMLSGETAAGDYPIEAVRTMAVISLRTEEDINYRKRLQSLDSLGGDMTYAIAHATCSIAHDLNAAAIVPVTHSGYTARMVSSFRPAVPIIGCTPIESTLRKLSLSWGVIPLKIEPHDVGEEMLADAVASVFHAGLVPEGGTVVLTAGIPMGVPGTTNLIRVDIAGK
jgi:pyruvate kinase